MSEARTQSQYQVRFDWGLEGAAAIAQGAHVLVWVDALPSDDAPDPAGVDVPAIVLGSIGSRAAVAEWVLARQTEIGDRAIIAVAAAGVRDGRFAVEDLVAAGAVIDAIADIGIDFTSPEAAAAVGAFSGLKNAASHVLTASVSGKELAAAGNRDAVDAARSLNASPELRILKE